MVSQSRACRRHRDCPRYERRRGSMCPAQLACCNRHHGSSGVPHREESRLNTAKQTSAPPCRCNLSCSARVQPDLNSAQWPVYDRHAQHIPLTAQVLSGEKKSRRTRIIPSPAGAAGEKTRCVPHLIYTAPPCIGNPNRDDITAWSAGLVDSMRAACAKMGTAGQQAPKTAAPVTRNSQVQ